MGGSFVKALSVETALLVRGGCMGWHNTGVQCAVACSFFREA